MDVKKTTMTSKQGLERIWPTLQPLLHGVFRRFRLDQEAADLSQQVALRLMQVETEIASDQQLLAYGLKVARWVALDHLRSMPPAPASDAETALLDIEDQGAGPLEQLEGAQLFETAMAAMSPREREAFVAVVLEGRDAGQAASQLGVGSATVRSLLRLARRRLLVFFSAQPGARND
jgi:RNA polymerase sigma-70 factor (ECF subfamily)